jgi:hypothetical protein
MFKKYIFLLILSLFSIQGFAAGCPDGSEPVRSISADGTYFVFDCGNSGGSYEKDGLYGYMSSYATSNSIEYGYGLSFYTNIWASFDNYLIDNYQIGHGTWITPENSDRSIPLCPKGTMARDNWPERAPSYADVFQTIEGGPGYWWNTKFPSKQMKYRVNGTTDCYTSQISSPGWTWDGEPIGSIPGLAQLSNKLLYPPDGVTFNLDANPKFLGNAWMSLPLTSKKISDTGHITGPNNWTLFLKAKNFNGPVVYWVPEAWSNISKNYPPANGRTLDSQPKMGYRQSMANEINTVYMFKSLGQNKKIYSRIPKLKFPIDEKNRTIFHQDVKMYSKEAIYNQVENAINYDEKFPDGRFHEKGIHDAKLNTGRLELKHNNKVIKSTDGILELKSFSSGNNRDYAWGIQWNKKYKDGYFPDYFIDQNITFINEEIINESGLTKNSFPIKKTGKDYVPAYSSVNITEGHEVFNALLNDGSVVTYKWFKFIDQPAIKKLNLKSDVLKKLQKTVEKIHTLWTVEKDFIAPPTCAKLVTIEKSLLVKPPSGMEIGYVPIVLDQKIMTNKEVLSQKLIEEEAGVISPEHNAVELSFQKEECISNDYLKPSKDENKENATSEEYPTVDYNTKLDEVCRGLINNSWNGYLDINKNEFNSKGYMFIVAGEDGRCESGIGRTKENALNECTKWQEENNIAGVCELYAEGEEVVWDGHSKPTKTDSKEQPEAEYPTVDYNSNLLELCKRDVEGLWTNRIKEDSFLFVVTSENGNCEYGLGNTKYNAFENCTKNQEDNNIVGICELYGEAGEVVWDGSVWDDSVKASKSASKEVSILETNESVDYVERLKQVKALLDSGIINQDDFEKMKQKIIDTMN